MRAPTLSQRAGWMIVVALVTTALLVLRLRGYIHLYDEAFHLVSAKRLALGEAPYRDFFYHYPPGQILLTGALYRLFGVELMVSRLLDSAVRLALVLLLFSIAWRPAQQYSVGRSLLLVAGVLMAALTLATLGAFSYSIYMALAMGAGALLLLVHFSETADRRRLWLAGALTAMAASVRWDVAVYLLLAQMALLGWLLLPNTRALPARATWKDALHLLLPFAAVAGAIFLWTGWRFGFGPLWQQAFVFPITTLRDNRALALPAITGFVEMHGGVEEGVRALTLGGWRLTERSLRGWLTFWLPLIAWLTLLARFLRASIPGRPRGVAPAPELLILTVFGAALMGQAVNRFDAIHAQPMLALFWVVTGLAVATGFVKLKRPWRGVGAVIVSALILFFAWPSLLVLRSNLASTPPWRCASTLPQLNCAAIVREVEEAHRYIERTLPAGDPLFVGLTRHDVIYMNDMASSWISSRAPATFDHLLEPGLATTEPVQARIVADLEATRPALLLRVEMPPPPPIEPLLARQSSGVTLLDDYLDAHYAQEVAFGKWQVHRRLPLP